MATSHSDRSHREPKLVRRLRDQRARHRTRPRVVRVLYVLVGLTLTLGGLGMLVLPGPAFIVIPIGLAILSLEFSWAEHLLERALVRGEAARRKAAAATPAQKALSVAATACAIGAAVAAALVWDIPFLPV